MRTAVLGDTHGRRHWRRVRTSGSWDRVVFLGDYLDTREGIPGVVQLENLAEILEWKRRAGPRVVLLLGNHDFHYLPWCEGVYSQYQRQFHGEFQELLLEGLDQGHLEPVFFEAGNLFSHAGVSRVWCQRWGLDFEEPQDLAAQIRDLWRRSPEAWNFQGTDMFGDDPSQGPFWIRQRSLQESWVWGVRHVVGHTMMDQIQEVRGDRGTSALFCDTQAQGTFGILESGAWTEVGFSSLGVD